MSSVLWLLDVHTYFIVRLLQVTKRHYVQSICKCIAVKPKINGNCDLFCVFVGLIHALQTLHNSVSHKYYQTNNITTQQII